jgi:hypothetical protein
MRLLVINQIYVYLWCTVRTIKTVGALAAAEAPASNRFVRIYLCEIFIIASESF